MRRPVMVALTEARSKSPLARAQLNPRRVPSSWAPRPEWNPIEHRLFSQISCNWAGVPLRTWDTLLAFIRGTSTRSGLTGRAVLERAEYPTGQKITDARFVGRHSGGNGGVPPDRERAERLWQPEPSVQSTSRCGRARPFSTVRLAHGVGVVNVRLQTSRPSASATSRRRIPRTNWIRRATPISRRAAQYVHSTPNGDRLPPSS
jgi:hypothetical protein